MFRVVISTENRAYSRVEPRPRTAIGAILGWMARSYRAFRQTQDRLERPGRF
jgi:hypothetical protein